MIFPNLDIDFEKHEAQEIAEEAQSTTLGLVPKWDFINNRMVMLGGRMVYCTEIEAVEQWIETIIVTPSNRYKIYDDADFGNSAIELLIGAKSPSADYIKSRVETELTEKIMRHKLITNVSNFIFTNNNGEMTISFTITTTTGLKKEVIYNVL